MNPLPKLLVCLTMAGPGQGIGYGTEALSLPEAQTAPSSQTRPIPSRPKAADKSTVLPAPLPRIGEQLRAKRASDRSA